MLWAPFETRHGRGWIGWVMAGPIERLVLPGQPMPAGIETAPPTQIDRLMHRLSAYFNGSGKWPAGDRFLPAAASTAFDAAVYRIVTAIPVGATMSYSEVAARAGRPGAARAVGAAMAKNRFAPMIPCHRVIGSDGSLRGYAGGLPMKQTLLEMEAADG